MLAVTNGHTNVVQVLVDHGTQLDCTDKHMCTALHRAVSRTIFCYGLSFIDVLQVVCGFDECVDILLQANADPTAR